MRIIKNYLLVLLFAQSVFAQSWKLVWSDEFDGAALNTSNWTYEIGNGNSGWGNNELEYYTSRPENIKLENGELVITARQESYGGKNYTSARIKTQGKQAFKYGRIEAYMKFPLGQGAWPAFWTLGENISFLGWPKCGEIDIMEHINNETNVHATVHWDNNGHVSATGATSFDVTQYHLYAIEWNNTQIKWYVDLKPYYTFNIVNNVNGTEEFHNPHFIILNLAIGGNWPGNPNGSMTFPISMKVDYVRVYEQVTDISESEKLPTGFSLVQNYPNPFNPETTIQYNLPAAGQVNLKIFDMLGNEVATLINEYKETGSHEVKFNPNKLQRNINSGIYFYTLNAGGMFSTKKMIYLK